jgi:beta-mannosidase
MEDRCWVYRTRLPAGGDRWLVVEDLDYACEIRLDGRLLHRQEGGIQAIDLELPAGEVLDLIVLPVPKSSPDKVGHQQVDNATKAAVSYGWDFHPRLVPLGVNGDVRIEIRPQRHLAEAEVRYRLSPCRTRAALQLAATVRGSGAPHWTITDPDGRVVLETTDAQAEIDRIRLWWPNGHGEQALYRWTCELRDGAQVLDRRSGRIGFKTVRLIPFPGAWDEPAEFPKTRSLPPIQIEINGQAIFAKGSNWVPPDIFPGTVAPGRWRGLVQLAHSANLNLLRVWGGGGVPHPAFFDACDELGLLVWQEFPLACLCYSEAPEYLALLEREARALVRRLRGRACLALWCGGNELLNGWSRMTDQHPALRLLNAITYAEDPQRPFLIAAPVMGMGHGDYRFRGDGGRECFAIMASARNTAYSEFGCGALSPVATLRRVIPTDQLWPARPGTAWETHGGIGAWDKRFDTWCGLETITHYWGATGTLDEAVERGQFLQAVGFRLMFEEARRQAPRCAMAVNWCFNEPWATAANNSVVAWPAEPKPALAAIGLACRPTCITAQVPQFAWPVDGAFEATLWLLHDTAGPRAAALVHARLDAGGTVIPLGTWVVPAGSGNQRGPTVRGSLPTGFRGRFDLVLEVDGQPGQSSRYTFITSPAV